MAYVRFDRVIDILPDTKDGEKAEHPLLETAKLQQTDLRGVLSNEKTLPMTQEEIAQQQAEINAALTSLTDEQRAALDGLASALQSQQ